MAKSREYWAKRAKQKVLASEKTTKKLMRNTLGIYEQAQNSILEDIRTMYNKASKELGIDISTYMKQTVHGKERDRLIKEIENLAKERGVAFTLSEDFGRRLTRLDVLQKKVSLEIKRVRNATNKLQKSGYEKVIDDAYRHTLDDLKEMGKYPLEGGNINKSIAKQIATSDAKWESGTYVSRNGKNTRRLSNRINSIIGAGMATGQSVEKTARQIRREFDISRYKAMRLVQTESAYYYGQADLEAYKQYGIIAYEYMDILDEKTCVHCKDLDGLTFSVDSAIVGENYPPIHPWCRCTTVPVV